MLVVLIGCSTETRDGRSQRYENWARARTAGVPFPDAGVMCFVVLAEATVGGNAISCLKVAP